MQSFSLSFKHQRDAGQTDRPEKSVKHSTFPSLRAATLLSLQASTSQCSTGPHHPLLYSPILSHHLQIWAPFISEIILISQRLAEIFNTSGFLHQLAVFSDVTSMHLCSPCAILLSHMSKSHLWEQTVSLIARRSSVLRRTPFYQLACCLRFGVSGSIFIPLDSIVQNWGTTELIPVQWTKNDCVTVGW